MKIELLVTIINPLIFSSMDPFDFSLYNTGVIALVRWFQFSSISPHFTIDPKNKWAPIMNILIPQKKYEQQNEITVGLLEGIISSSIRVLLINFFPHYPLTYLFAPGYALVSSLIWHVLANRNLGSNKAK